MCTVQRPKTDVDGMWQSVFFQAKGGDLYEFIQKEDSKYLKISHNDMANPKLGTSLAAVCCEGAIFVFYQFTRGDIVRTYVDRCDSAAACVKHTQCSSLFNPCT